MKHFTRTRSEMLSSVVSVLAPLGWATFGRWHKDETTRIVRLHSQGAEASEIDSVVTELWNSTSIVLLKNIAAPLRRYGRTIDHEFQRQNFQRGNLIDEAIACHFNGHYGAATLLTYAQIDGFTRDITGSSFFSGSTDDTYMDDSTLAGFEGNLPVVREFFSEPINETGFYSKLSRHGAAHGRDLSFANRVTSTKALVLLGALTEYLEDRANTKAQKQARQNEIQARGLSGTDDTGRLLDDRHFDRLYFFAADLDTWVSTKPAYLAVVTLNCGKTKPTSFSKNVISTARDSPGVEVPPLPTGGPIKPLQVTTSGGQPIATTQGDP